MSKKAAAGKKGGKKEEDKKKEDKPKINYEEMIFNNLENFKLTYDQSGYHYTDLNLAEKKLDNITPVFSNYVHLQRIWIQGTNISDFNQLATLPNLIEINASNNNIKDLKSLYVEENFKNLQRLDLSNNRVVELQSIKPQFLTHLNLNNNSIEKLEAFEGHPKLKVLNLAGNRISSTAQIANLPELQELYLGNNKLKQLVGLELSNLIVLHLRGNSLEQLFEESLPPLENLQYLNIRENKFEKFEEFEKLINPNVEKLRTLVFSYNPIITKNQNYLYETINKLLKITRINKTHITKNIRISAYQYARRKHLEEQARLKAEEEERLRLEREEEERAAAAEN